MASEQAERALKLKNEGNVLFSKREFAPASVKYTEAIALDEENPILYSNRSACRLNLKQYLDAAADALVATELNPSYGKAWARLATAKDALRQPWASVRAWENALKSLPNEDLSESELKQKKEYETGLAAATKAFEAYQAGTDRGHRVEMSTKDMSITPWMTALAMMPQLEREHQFESLAIGAAYLDFEKANEWMNQQKQQQRSEGVLTKARLKVIEYFTNAIMMDSRVFHISDPKWAEKFNVQLQIENNHHRTWVHYGPEKLFEEAPERLAKEGWDSVRPAVSTTIRSWMLFGFIEGGSRGNFISEAEHMGRALQVIDWGRRTWPDVPTEERGVIFLDSFRRGVQKLHIEALVKVCGSEKDTALKLQGLEALSKLADVLIENTDKSGPPPLEDGSAFASAFYFYPRGHAYAAKGYCYGRKAELEEDHAKQQELHLHAGFAYLKASEDFWPDDEHRAGYLNAALQHMINGGLPVGMSLKYMAKLRESIEKIQPIWGKMQALQGLTDKYDHVLKYEKKYKELLAEGKITEDMGLQKMSDPTTPGKFVMEL